MCQRAFTKGSALGGVDASLQWSRGEDGCELVHSRYSKLAWKTSPHMAVHYTVHFLFIYFGWGANVCSVALDISDRKDQRATPQMKLSKWPDSWVPRRTSLARTFLLWSQGNLSTARRKERKGRKKKENHNFPNQRERKRDKTSAAVSLLSMMEWIMNVWRGFGNNGSSHKDPRLLSSPSAQKLISTYNSSVWSH